jgi:hypothetical protein
VRDNPRVTSQPPEQEPIGPAAWRNWRAAGNGEPWRQRVEHGLYSDSGFVGDLPDLGPYWIMNTVSRTSPASPGDVQQNLVLRQDWHLPNEALLMRADPNITQVDAYHGGWVDEELAALLSLALGVRCRSGGPIRFWSSADDPLGRPSAFYHRPPTISRPRFSIIPNIARDSVQLDDCRPLLDGYRTLDAAQSIALVRAARQYQLAVWSVDDDANLAWLQLVGALEAAAAPQFVQGTSLALIDELWPELADLLRQTDLNGAEDVVDQLAHLVRATKKVRQLIKRHEPSPLHPRPPEHEQVKWSNLTDRVTRIYQLRSKALHEGVPIPGPLLEPPMPGGTPLPERPGATHGIGDAVWVDDDMPMYFHVFAHVVREVLCKWWKDLLTTSAD